MILDAFQMFDLPSAPRDLAQVVGDYASTNILDYGIIAGIPAEGAGTLSRDMGIGDRPALKLFARVSTAFTSGGAATLVVSFQGSISDAAGAPAAWVTWWVSPAYALATMAIVGNRFLNIDFPRPPAGVAVPRFVRLLYTIGGATTTAGKVVAGVVLDRDDQMYAGTNSGVLGGYPAGLNVAN